MALSEDQLADLSSEISGDPLTRGYSGMTDQQIADDLNTAYRTRDATISSLQVYCFNNSHNPTLGTRVTTSIWRLCKDLSEGSTITDTAPTQQAQDAGWALVQLLERAPDSEWDMSEANLDVLLGRLVTADAIAEADRTALKNLSNNQLTRANELGLPTVQTVWVTEAKV